VNKNNRPLVGVSVIVKKDNKVLISPSSFSSDKKSSKAKLQSL